MMSLFSGTPELRLPIGIRLEGPENVREHDKRGAEQEGETVTEK